MQLTKYICINELICALQQSHNIDVMVIIIPSLWMTKLSLRKVKELA